MIRAHILALVGLAASREQRWRSLVVLLGGGFLLSISMGFDSRDWGTQALTLLLAAALLVQWRSTLFHPADARPELPIPFRRTTADWVMGGLQAVSVGAVAYCLELAADSYHPLRCGIGCTIEHPPLMLVTTALEVFVEALVAVLILVPTLVVGGRWVRGMGAQREIFVWAAGPALAAISVVCMALDLPEIVVYAVWLVMFVALIVTAVLFIGRLVGGLRRWRQGTRTGGTPLFRDGQKAHDRLGRDSRAGIGRAIALMVGSDVVGWCVLWFTFSSWMFHDLGLDGLQAQNYVAPVGMALLVGARILSLASLLGQVGLVGGFAPWAQQPWALLPLPRGTIQRALLRHIAVVALVAIGLNIAFLATWGEATEALLWSEQHVQLRGLIAHMVQSLAVVTGIMAMAFMVVGTGLRNTAQMACVGGGAVLSVIIFVVNVPVPGAAAAYVPTALVNALAIALITAAVWVVSSRGAGRLA